MDTGQLATLGTLTTCTLSLGLGFSLGFGAPLDLAYFEAVNAKGSVESELVSKILPNPYGWTKWATLRSFYPLSHLKNPKWEEGKILLSLKCSIKKAIKGKNWCYRQQRQFWWELTQVTSLSSPMGPSCPPPSNFHLCCRQLNKSPPNCVWRGRTCFQQEHAQQYFAFNQFDLTFSKAIFHCCY